QHAVGGVTHDRILRHLDSTGRGELVADEYALRAVAREEARSNLDVRAALVEREAARAVPARDNTRDRRGARFDLKAVHRVGDESRRGDLQRRERLGEEADAVLEHRALLDNDLQRVRE